MRKIEKKMIGIVSRILHIVDSCPVIYYHDIVMDGKGDSYQYTDISVFEKHMQYIADCGLQSLTFDDLRNNPQMLKQKGHIVICFDDGYISNYLYAYPICKKYNIKMNIFIEGNAVFSNREGYLSAQHIAEMHESGMVGIGAHTWNHIDCQNLTEDNASIEIDHENQSLCDVLKIDRITDFCFPYGSYDQRVIDYLSSRSTYERIYTSDNKKFLVKNRTTILGRIAIENTDTEREFKDKAKGYFGSYRIFKRLKNRISKG